MGRHWIVSVPCWGDKYRDIFTSVGLPMIRLAAERLDPDDHIRLLVHTDAPREIKSHARGRLTIETFPVPTGQQWFHSMSRAHRAAIAHAQRGDVIVLLTADMTISENALTACAHIFASGKKLVCINATRTKESGVIPYRPTSRELSEWAWKNRHDIVRTSTWPDGQMEDLCRVYFENGPEVVCRLWLSHPLALEFDGRSLEFGPTIDCNLVTNFKPSEVYVVTDPDVLCAIEISPDDKPEGARDQDEPPARTDLGPMSRRYRLLPPISPEVYRYVLSRRIIVSGTGEGCGDAEAVKGLL